MKIVLGVLMVMGLLFGVQVDAEPLVEGRVRLASGEPAVGAQVLLFDLTNLRAAPIGATTDETGYFALPFAALSGASALPERFDLGQNYPNPFNPSTTISYQLPTAMPVRLEVFDVLGQRIALLVDGERAAGFHTVRWDATDAAGWAVAAGVYFYRLSGDGVHLTRSMVLIDGQAGVPEAGGSVAAPEEALEMGSSIYGLTVSGWGLVPYVDPAFRVAVDREPVDLVVETLGSKHFAAKVAAAGVLGDVDNNGRVDIFDALLVAVYSANASIVMPNNGDIALGDVNRDGRTDLTDAYLIATYSVNPSDPVLPAGIGAPPEAPATGVSKLYWADFGTDKIQRANLDGSGVEDLVTSGLGDPYGLALDVAGGKMYWTDVGTDKIQRADLDGSGVEDLVTSGLGDPYGLALDVAGGKMYWTDVGTDKIQRADLDSSGVEDLVTSGLGDPYGLALDVAGGKMYWTDFGTDKIQRADLDGSGIEDLVTSGLGDPYGLALDVAGGKMYWTDFGTDKIQRANLDGSGVEDLVTSGLGDPYGLALDVAGGKMYWTDVGTDKIQRANLDGSGVEDLVTSGLGDPNGLALGDDSQAGSSPGTASLSPDPSTVSFGDDGAWHQFTVQSSESVVVVANPGTTAPRVEITTGSGRPNYCPAEADDDHARQDGEAIYLAGCAAGTGKVELRRASDQTVLQTYTFTVSSGPDLLVESPSVSDSSPDAGASFTLSATVRNQGDSRSASTTLRYYRSTNTTISASDTPVETDAVSSLAASGTSDESISVTAPSSAGTYYYGACVESVSGESDTRNNCSNAVIVTVASEIKDTGVSKLYWGDWGTGKIQRADLDGSNVEDLVTTGLRTPYGLAVDEAGDKLYWTDWGTVKIQRADLDGSNVEDVITSGLVNPWGLAVDEAGDKLYWTDVGTDKIRRADLDGSNVEDVITTGLSTPWGLALHAADDKLYWTDWGTSKIQRADLDGSNVEDLVTSGLVRPSGLALDVADGKMYWTNGGASKIQRADLDGSNVEDLVTSGLRNPYGLALDVASGKMYWTDPLADKIRRANLDGSNVEDLVTSGLVGPNGLALGGR